MSEWVSVFVVFWILWILDGARLAPRRIFTVVGWRAGWTRTRFSRVSLPGVWPSSWRVVSADVPLALSPLGICNRPVGVAGRPAELGPPPNAWKWEEIQSVGVAKGWVYVNGVRFCADTGHLKGSELLALARLPVRERESAVRARIDRWLRPAQLRRRVRVLRGRTAVAATLNSVSLVILLLLTVYVGGNFAARVPAEWNDRLTNSLPALLLTLLALHLVAVVSTWRALRFLRAVGPEKRRSTLFSASLLPPQAMRLRALAGEGFFPAQHPLVPILAFGRSGAKASAAFNVLTDLRWPVGTGTDAPLAREIADWYRSALEKSLRPLLREAKLSVDRLLAPPQPDGKGSCLYCPRCGDQFLKGNAVCPNGVPLRSLERR